MTVFLNVPLALRPLLSVAWVAVFGVALAVASPEIPRTWLFLATGAGFQLIATSIFAVLATLWRGPFAYWWRVAGALIVMRGIMMSIFYIFYWLFVLLQI